MEEDCTGVDVRKETVEALVMTGKVCVCDEVCVALVTAEDDMCDGREAVDSENCVIVGICDVRLVDVRSSGEGLV